MNAGAVALLSTPVKPESLKNYVHRAVTAGKADRDRQREIDRYRESIEHEKTCTEEQAVETVECRRLLRGCYRLINHMLVTAGLGRGLLEGSRRQ